MHVGRAPVHFDTSDSYAGVRGQPMRAVTGGMQAGESRHRLEVIKRSCKRVLDACGQSTTKLSVALHRSCAQVTPPSTLDQLFQTGNVPPGGTGSVRSRFSAQPDIPVIIGRFNFASPQCLGQSSETCIYMYV